MLIGLMLIINTGHQSRQNVIIIAIMRISALFELDNRVQVIKLFRFSFRFCTFFISVSDKTVYNRSPKSRINKGKNRKYPEMSKPKGFRSLRAFHMAGEEGFEQNLGIFRYF